MPGVVRIVKVRERIHREVLRGSRRELSPEGLGEDGGAGEEEKSDAEKS